MKFQLLGPWPVGQHLIEAGTIVDATEPQWQGIAMPINAMPLTQDAADYMSRLYPHHLDQLRAGPGVRIRRLLGVTGSDGVEE